jgi:uncharacterized protein
VDEALLTFTSEPLASDIQVVGFPVVFLRLATSGSDGAIYVYLEAVAPDGKATYVTEGCLRFIHRATTGPAEPTRLGVPRTFASADRLTVGPAHDLDLAVDMLPIAALFQAGHKIRVALSGHDAACFDRYGPPDETFTIQLGRTVHARPADPASRGVTTPTDVRARGAAIISLSKRLE